MRLIYLKGLLALYFMISCSVRDKHEPAQEIASINFVDLRENNPFIGMDGKWKQARFVQLETTNDCRIKAIDEVIIDEQRILVKEETGKLFSFDKEGKYLPAAESSALGGIQWKGNDDSQPQSYVAGKYLYFPYHAEKNLFHVFWNVQTQQGVYFRSDTLQDVFYSFNHLVATTADSFVCVVYADEAVKARSQGIYNDASITKLLANIRAGDNPILAFYMVQ